MELREAIEKRCSVRKYKPDPIPYDIIYEILEFARQAPSAGGLRGYRVNPTNLPITRYNSPATLVISAEVETYGQRYGERGRELYSVQDATIIGAYIQLLAVEAGLSTVWVGAFRETKVKRQLGLDKELRPIALMPIGYADDN